MLVKRIVSAALGIVLLITVVALDKFFINIAITIISIIALYELFSAVDNVNKIPIAWVAYIATVFIVFGEYIYQGFKMPLLYIGVLILFVIKLISHNRIALSHIAITIFAVIYISFFMSHISFVKSMPNGQLLIWLIFLGAWSTDTFAFFSGVFIGKHKLMPSISPKKTIEGAIGGILGCGGTFLLYGYIIHIFRGYQVSYGYLLLLGLICAVVSELGDLAASSIKRQYHIKDFGNIMPGHGGVLDRFDSIIFVAPVVYYFIKNIQIFF